MVVVTRTVDKKLLHDDINRKINTNNQMLIAKKNYINIIGIARLNVTVLSYDQQT